MTEKVTITEVAKRAGVSTATAGRVLGNYGYTSEDNKQKVRTAAAELDYRPNLLARGLITGKTKTIGIVAGDVQSPFYASVLRGIGNVARAQGFGVLLTNSDEILSREVEGVKLLLEKQADGLIVAPCDTERAFHLHSAVKSMVPVVQIDRVVRNLNTDSVTVNNRLASKDRIIELFALGHSRIAMVAELERWEGGNLEAFIQAAKAGTLNPGTLFPSWQRLYGFIEAHLEANIQIDSSQIFRAGVYSVDAARREAIAALSGTPPPTAIFAADGLMSAGVMGAITMLGVRIPQDLSLICFDDLDWMSFLQPGISAVVQPLVEMGEIAAKLLLERLSGNMSESRHISLEPSFAARGSIAAPA